MFIPVGADAPIDRFPFAAIGAAADSSAGG